MTKWDLFVGDGSRIWLVATLDERQVTANGDRLAPSLLLPFGWEEILPKGLRQESIGRVIAVSVDLHSSQAQTQYAYWVRTGFQPVSRQLTPTLPLSLLLVEELSRIAQARPDGDVVLNMSVSALAAEQEAPSSIRTHWHQNPRPVHISAAQWQAMLKQWGYPATRLVFLNMELPPGVGDHNKAARDAWAEACSRLSAVQQAWAVGRIADAGEELRHVVQLAIRTWGALWHPDKKPRERDDWRGIVRRLGDDIGCDAHWSIRPEATADAQRAYTFLMLLRNLNTMANPFHHVGASAVYTHADVDMLVTASTAVMRSLPEFWRQFGAPPRWDIGKPAQS